MHAPEAISLTTALAHEALVPQVDALLAQLARSTGKRAEAPVPPELLRIAERLFAELRRFTKVFGHTRTLWPTTTHAALAARLGQARALLDAFEARHAPWDPALGCHAWILGRDSRRPVARLRPRPLTPPVATPRQSADMARMRQNLAKLIDSRYDEGFRKGQDAARKALPHER